MSWKTNILKDPELNLQLIERGFVKVSGFDPTKLERILHDIVSELNFPISSLRGNQNAFHKVTFHSTFADQRVEYKKTVWKYLKPLFEEASNKFLIDHKVIQTNVFNKPPGTGYLTPHQNLTTVDEEKFASVSMWVPLQNTDEANGTLFLKPGSHGHFETCRNGNTLWPPLTISEKIEDYGMIPMNLKSGELLIFDDSLVHASPNNTTDRDRLVFHCVAIPSVASVIYCRNNGLNIELVEVADDFWQMSDPISVASEGKILKTVPAPNRTYSLQSLKDEMVR